MKGKLSVQSWFKRHGQYWGHQQRNGPTANPNNLGADAMNDKLIKATALAAAALVTFAAAALVTMPAQAGQRQDTVDANQAIERQRIEDARLKGELSRREYRQLNAEQARIAEMERQAQADGHISKAEYKKIHDAQIEAYRHIKQESTDKDGSPIRRWLYKHPGK
jgi:hypothetical protein